MPGKASAAGALGNTQGTIGGKKVIDPAESRRIAKADKPVAVVDIGSNSVRLVIFDGPRRVPTPIFNEKVLCGLGRNLDQTGRLDADGVEMALASVTRFAGLAKVMGASRLDLLATAAVREAENGADFVREVEARCDAPVHVLTGDDEARLSAQGVLSGMPSARGFMGDLGGGSLELVTLGRSVAAHSATLPLGPLRMQSLSDGDRDLASSSMAKWLEGLEWLAGLEGLTFYPVGGAWRSLARVHMEQTGYPLHMIHGYTLSRRETEEVSRVVAQLGKRSLSRMSSVSKRRVETLPYAALLMEQVLARAKPDRVVFSAFGLREGWIFELLETRRRKLDPLLVAAQDWETRDQRFANLGAAMCDWTAPLFQQDEGTGGKRLREAACHLADIAWRDHPDYRAFEAYHRILHSPFLCVEHYERAYLALAVYCRYGGRPEDKDVSPVLQVLKPKKVRRAEVLGLSLRLGIGVSAGDAELLRSTELSWDGAALRLDIPKDAPVPPGPALEKRFSALSSALGAEKSKIDSL